MIQHIGIIMDWNRRWAKKRMLPAFAGHKAWADNVVKVVEYADEIWISYITLWALSTENLQKRSSEEVQWIITLVNSIEKYLDRMKVKELKFQTIGDISKLPVTSQEILQKIKNKTKNNTGITVTIALIYGWQDDIVRATKKIISHWIDPETLSEEEFRKYLDTSILPIPDIILRTGGDIRHSWFLLFDSAYSEYYFSEKKWPEFDKQEFKKVIDTFNTSKRNFWK